jgi:hypothetical protein
MGGQYTPAKSGQGHWLFHFSKTLRNFKGKTGNQYFKKVESFDCNKTR